MHKMVYRNIYCVQKFQRVEMYKEGRNSQNEDPYPYALVYTNDSFSAQEFR